MAGGCRNGWSVRLPAWGPQCPFLLLWAPPGPRTLDLFAPSTKSWPVGVGDHGCSLLLDPTESVKVDSGTSAPCSFPGPSTEDRQALGSDAVRFATPDICCLKQKSSHPLGCGRDCCIPPSSDEKINSFSSPLGAAVSLDCFRPGFETPSCCA